MRLADAQHLGLYRRVLEDGRAEFSPIQALAARNDVVDSGQGKLLMGEMTMQHRATNTFLSQRIPHCLPDVK